MTAARPADGASPVTLRTTDAIAWLTLDRPKRRNALSLRLLQELERLAGRIASDSGVRVVVLRGQGPAFSSGLDLGERAAGPDGRRQRIPHFDVGRRVVDALAGMRPVTIASVQGSCIGGGMVLAAACDLRVATTSARFCLPEAGLGLPVAWGGIPRLVQALGPAATRELVLTGRAAGAQELHNSGFLGTVVPDDLLATATERLARRLADAPQDAIETTKQQLEATLAADSLRAALRAEARVFEEALAAPTTHATGERDHG